ncbi:MAG: hypothetical protein EA402_10345 [Planctomycetota bacterium]|nr:MAG: hypothetical protein EA402_10345 [Planctomycetota bacterium]
MRWFLRPLSLSVLLGLLTLGAGQLWGADQGEADGHLRQGIEHLKAADNDPTRLVDGAISMASALDIYRELEDWDSVTQVQASLYWARKRMNRDQIQDYLARGGAGDPEERRRAAEAAFDVADAVVNEEVDASDAQRYFESAARFAENNSDEHFLVAIRYFEVAERFAGSEVAVDAQRRSLAAQQEFMAAFQREAEAKAEEQRNTLFTRSVDAGSGSLEVPDRREQSRASREIRELFGTRLRERDTQRQWELAEELLESARGTNHDVGLRYGLLSQALDLARDSGGCHLVWDISHQIAEDFTGQNAVDLMQQALSRMRSSSAGRAMLTLLEDPLNADANSLVGQFYLLEAERTEMGLEMLVLGSDQGWRNLAQMERANPRNAQEQYEVARAWDALVSGERDNQRNLAMRRRALHRYQQAESDLTGIAKTTAQRRIAEITPTIPLTDANWNRLSAADWERVPGQVVTVNAARDNSVNITLRPGQKMRVVPHPEDRWTYYSYSTETQHTYKGGTKYMNENFARGSLVIDVDDTMHGPGIIEGPARQISMHMHRGSRFSRWHRGEGTIRVKVVPVD